MYISTLKTVYILEFATAFGIGRTAGKSAISSRSGNHLDVCIVSNEEIHDQAIKGTICVSSHLRPPRN